MTGIILPRLIVPARARRLILPGGGGGGSGLVTWWNGTTEPAVTGGTDVNAGTNLNTLLNGASAGQVFNLLDGDYGTFEINGLNFPTNNPVIVRSKNPRKARILAGRAVSCTGIEFRQLHLCPDTTTAEREGYGGMFMARSCTQVNFRWCKVDNTTDAANWSTWTHGTWLANNEPRSGASLSDSNAYKAGIYVIGSSIIVEYCTVRGFTYGIVFENASDVIARNNHLQGIAGDGIRWGCYGAGTYSNCDVLDNVLECFPQVDTTRDGSLLQSTSGDIHNDAFQYFHVGDGTGGVLNNLNVSRNIIAELNLTNYSYAQFDTGDAYTADARAFATKIADRAVPMDCARESWEISGGAPRGSNLQGLGGFDGRVNNLTMQDNDVACYSTHGLCGSSIRTGTITGNRIASMRGVTGGPVTAPLTLRKGNRSGDPVCDSVTVTGNTVSSVSVEGGSTNITDSGNTLLTTNSAVQTLRDTIIGRVPQFPVW